MKRCFSAVLLLCMSGACIAYAEDDPWAPARAGKIECIKPDFERKTCASMATYSWNSNGTITSEDIAILYGAPGVVQNTRTEMTQHGSRMCVVFNAHQIETSTFQRDGHSVSPQDAEAYRKSLLSSYEPVFGRKFCADISPLGSVYIVQITVDGTELPSATTRLAWIDAKDGFQVSN